MAPARRSSHSGQYGLGHAQHAEVVRLEECLDPVDRHVLDRPAAADAGVVDEDVDAPGLVEHLGHAALDGSGVIDVQGDDPHAQALGVDRRAKVGGGGRLADAGPDVVALAAEVQGRGQADAGAGAGDQGDGHDASSEVAERRLTPTWSPPGDHEPAETIMKTMGAASSRPSACE